MNRAVLRTASTDLRAQILGDRARRVFIVLVAVDLAFIGLDVVSRAADVSDPGRLLLTTDRGYAELFQYLKILGIVWLLGAIAVRIRELVFYVWASLLGYLLADDLLRIHETVGGEFLGDALQNFSLTAGDNGYELGQILFSAVVGGLLLVVVLLATRASSRSVRRTSYHLLALLFVFAFFSLFVDAAGSWSDFAGRSVIEDGGELIAMSVIAGFALSVHPEGEMTAGNPGADAPA